MLAALQITISYIYVRDYLNWIHDIQDKNALYSIDPIQTREWARRVTKGPLNSFVNWFSEAWSKLGNTHDKAKLRRTNPF